jgi:SAM-dependent methyltransferase
VTSVFADLGVTPLANSLLTSAQLPEAEPLYPLRAMMCGKCYLVQLDTVVDPTRVFSQYAYFSSYSESVVRAAQTHAERMVAQLSLRPGDRVVEIASNDGYLLQSLTGRGLDLVGVEPAANVAAAAIARGVPSLVRFFGADVARELADQSRARLIIANNVLAHVPAINDFLAGLQILLAPGGVATIEVHHLLSLVRECQFDHIYHEHFQYFSLHAARCAFARHRLAVVDVETIPAEGGSLRLFVQHEADASRGESAAVTAVLAEETANGLRDIALGEIFSERMRQVRLSLLAFLVAARQDGKSVAAYGAAAKGNTLLNYCGIHADLIDYVVDRNPHKQGRTLPGSRIPIHDPEMVRETRPDYLLILPWNLRDEVVAAMSHIRQWGGRFVVPLPVLDVF